MRMPLSVPCYAIYNSDSDITDSPYPFLTVFASSLATTMTCGPSAGCVQVVAHHVAVSDAALMGAVHAHWLLVSDDLFLRWLYTVWLLATPPSWAPYTRIGYLPATTSFCSRRILCCC